MVEILSDYSICTHFAVKLQISKLFLTKVKKPSKSWLGRQTRLTDTRHRKRWSYHWSIRRRIASRHDLHLKIIKSTKDFRLFVKHDSDESLCPWNCFCKPFYRLCYNLGTEETANKGLLKLGNLVKFVGKCYFLGLVVAKIALSGSFWVGFLIRFTNDLWILTLFKNEIWN